MQLMKRLAVLLGPSILVLAVVAAFQLKPEAVTASDEPHAPADNQDEVHAHGQDTAAAKSAEEPRDPNRLWCGEHGVYEDECVLCHPELASKPAASKSASGQDVLMCKDHRVPETECGICHPELTAELESGRRLKVRLASAESLAKAGVDTGRPKPSGSGDAFTITARVAYNQNHLAQVTARVPGVIVEVKSNAGDHVEKGDILAVIESTGVAEARGDYRTAVAELTLSQATYQREKRLHERGISAKRDFQEAEAALSMAQAHVAAAKERLSSLGLGSTDRDDGGSSLTVRAPFAATVTERNAVVGESVDTDHPLFVVANLSELWLELAVPEDRIAAIAVGDRVAARFGSLQGLAFDAEVSWIDSKIDEESRTVKARALVANPSGLLKHGMFGEAQLASAGAPGALELPAEAVQQVGGQPVVFVKLEDDLYELRRITLGQRRGPFVEVKDGLATQDEIVLARSFTLKSELLKSRLGAGCTDH